MLNERLGPMVVTGFVDRVESFPDGQRVTLHSLTIAELSAEEAPDAVRIKLRGAQPVIRPGDRISVRAVLTPPPPPAVPGAYDFQRQAYFDGLGGRLFGRRRDRPPCRRRPSVGVGLWFARLRAVVAERVRALLDATAAVTIALLNGEQQAFRSA
jgi:competence protein ComEC